MTSFSPVWLRRFWYAVGWFGIALLFYLSLAPQPPSISIEHGDKMGHALAYATLMYWWAQLLATTRQHLWLAAGLIALGIAIEYVQGWTGWRTFDYFDMLADAAGVVFGGVLATLAPNLFAFVRRFGNRPG